MNLKSLSASQLKKWLKCPASWAATYDNGTSMRTPELSGSSGSLGSALHEALEDYLVYISHEDYVHDDDADTVFLKAAYRIRYDELFSDQERFKEGQGMLLEWYAKQDWDGFEVVETEIRHEFPMDLSIGIIPFVYLFDRLDMRDDGIPRVVDYKSWIVPIQPEDIKADPQFRLYAAMAHLRFPDAERIQVVADQLRYDAVGAFFTAKECQEILTWLFDKAEEIITTEVARETLNEDCRYCIRKHQCETLAVHAKFDGPVSLDDIPALAVRRYELDSAMKAAKMMKDDIDAALIAHAEETEQIAFEGNDGVKVKLSVRRKNVGDPVLIGRALGAHTTDFTARYGDLNGPNVIKAAKDPANTIPGHIMEAAERAVRVEYSSPYVTTKKVLK